MTARPSRSRWLTGAENVPATETQLGQALGERCVEAGCVEPPRWQGLVATASQGPHTVAALRDLLSTLYLYAARRSPTLGAELRGQLADSLRLSE